MKNLKLMILVSLISSIVTAALVFIFLNLFQPKVSFNSPGYIPQKCWPEFDKTAPYIINGPLWVGFDENKNLWRYIKLSYEEKPGDIERGMVDPGAPSKWTDKQGQTGYFNGQLNCLPSGTHINNRYDPSTISSKYNLDDYMIKVGNFWVDKYESSIISVVNEKEFRWIDDPPFGGTDSVAKSKSGNGFNTSPKVFAVSQRKKPSSGITYFVAEQSAINNGKHIVRNEQWQAAASGTERTDATGMESGGETWEKIANQDISRYGLVGCVGSLWEWTSSWGQYGEHYEGKPTNWYDWPGPASYVEWDNEFDTYGNDIIINVAGRAYTRQDTARYAVGLPAALVRGGSWGDHNRAGIFAIIADGAPSYYGFEVGFRCVK